MSEEKKKGKLESCNYFEERKKKNMGYILNDIPLTKEFKIDIARLEIPVSG